MAEVEAQPRLTPWSSKDVVRHPFQSRRLGALLLAPLCARRRRTRFAALSIAFAAFNAGAGIIGAVALALIAGVGVLTIMRIGVAATRSWPLRLAITLIYAIPAGVAGYQLSGAFAGLGGASGAWRDAMAFLGALAVAAAARARLEAPRPDPAR